MFYRIFDLITEMVGWFLIALSPAGAGFIVAVIIWNSGDTSAAQWVAAGVAALGVLTGIWLATHIWCRHGTLAFLARIFNTPDIDRLLNEKNSRPTNSDK